MVAVVVLFPHSCCLVPGALRPSSILTASTWGGTFPQGRFYLLYDSMVAPFFRINVIAVPQKFKVMTRHEPRGSAILSGRRSSIPVYVVSIVRLLVPVATA